MNAITNKRKEVLASKIQNAIYRIGWYIVDSDGKHDDAFVLEQKQHIQAWDTELININAHKEQ